MIEIMQSATGLTLTLGPFVSQADGKTVIEGVDLTTADSAFIFKHSAASASFSIDSATWTSMGSGMYSLAATSSMFDTLGPAKISINDVSLILPYFLDVMVVHDNYWNAKYGTSPFMASASGGTIASVSNTVNCFATSIIGATIASVSNSVNFTTGTIASVSNTVNCFATSIIGATIASVSNSVNFTTGTIASVSNSVWWTAIRDVGSVTGNLLLNVVGNVQGTVASVSSIALHDVGTVTGNLAGTVASVSGSVYMFTYQTYIKLPTKSYITGTTQLTGDIDANDAVGDYPGNLPGTIGSVSSSVLVRPMVASLVWAALSSSFGAAGTFGGILGAMGAGADPWSSTVTNYTGTNTFGLLLGGLPSTTSLASTIMAIHGKAVYVPSATVEMWTIASVSNSVHIGVTDIGTVTGNVIGTVASVSSSVLIQAGQTVASVSNYSGWTIASVSGTAMTGLVAIQGKTDYLPSSTIGDWVTSGVASVSVVGIVSSVSASVVDGIFEEVIEGTTTLRQSQMYQNAFAAGKAVVTAGSATVSFRDVADTKNRLIMDVDEDGNRSAVTRDGT